MADHPYRPGVRVERVRPSAPEWKMRLDPGYPPGLQGTIIRYIDDGGPEPWDYVIRLDDGREVPWHYMGMRVIKTASDVPAESTNNAERKT